MLGGESLVDVWAARLQENIFLNLVPEDLTLDTDAGLLSVMIRILVDNANKYTEGGEIKIEASQNTLATHIIITDACQNMDEGLVKSIVEKTYNPTDSGQGWGYKIVIEILGMLNCLISLFVFSAASNLCIFLDSGTLLPLHYYKLKKIK